MEVEFEDFFGLKTVRPIYKSPQRGFDLIGPDLRHVQDAEANPGVPHNPNPTSL